MACYMTRCLFKFIEIKEQLLFELMKKGARQKTRPFQAMIISRPLLVSSECLSDLISHVHCGVDVLNILKLIKTIDQALNLLGICH